MVARKMLKAGAAIAAFVFVTVMAGGHQTALAQMYYYAPAPSAVPYSFMPSGFQPSGVMPGSVQPSGMMPSYTPVYRGVWPAVIVYAPAPYVAIPWKVGPMAYGYRGY